METTGSQKIFSCPDCAGRGGRTQIASNQAGGGWVACRTCGGLGRFENHLPAEVVEEAARKLANAGLGCELSALAPAAREYLIAMVRRREEDRLLVPAKVLEAEAVAATAKESTDMERVKALFK